MNRPWPTLAAVGLALVAAALLLWAVGTSPVLAGRLIFEGSLGSASRLANSLLAWAPLVLAAAGLVVTFAAGLWNIGVEGQVIVGAIAATWAARVVPGTAAVLVPATLAAGLIGGAGWALLAGLLRTRGRVNEIFGGLGLDFLAAGWATYLVIGPWKRAGIASTSGTDLFRPEASLPTLTLMGTAFPWVAVGLAVVALAGVQLLLRGSHFGLRLKAVGRNPQSAFLLGIPTDRYLLAALAIGGALAGLAGTVQATGFHHKLVPAISGGYGFGGILVVLLAGFATRWVAPIALFLVAVSTGATQLELRASLDSSFGGVLTGVVVLFVMLAGGFARRRRSEGG